jgi:hypothetical protein
MPSVDTMKEKIGQKIDFEDIEEARDIIRSSFVLSATPIIRFMPHLTKPEDIEKRITLFKKQLHDAPEIETGLRFSLAWIIKELHEDLRLAKGENPIRWLPIKRLTTYTRKNAS